MPDKDKDKNEHNNAEHTQGGEASAAREPDVDTATKKGAAEDELQSLREQLMRIQADFANAEKRRARETQQMRQYLLEGFITELLEVKDNLERVIESVKDDSETHKGLTIIEGHFSKILTNHNVKEIAPEGEMFNPEFHEAMSARADTNSPANTILQVVQKGYRLHERLIRPARVIVASKPLETQADTAETKENSSKDGAGKD